MTACPQTRTSPAPNGAGFPPNTNAELTLVYQDEHLLVLNKPSGLLSVPGKGPDKQDCLSARVQQRFPEALVVHRLDMGTSGLMIMARSILCQRQLNHSFATRAIGKRYEAVVVGAPEPDPKHQDGWSTIDQALRLDWPQRPKRVVDTAAGKPSQTRWRLKKSLGGCSLLELEPLTGRSHQLRVHLAALGHPILGDTLYANGRVTAIAPRLMLHACDLTFWHPQHDQALHVNCPSGFEQLSF